MNIANSLIKYLKLSETRRGSETPEGLCPNCWGRDEYGGQFFERVKNHGLDVNSKDPEIGWINEYAEKHLKGIKLEKAGSEYVCQRCKFSFKPSD